MLRLITSALLISVTPVFAADIVANSRIDGVVVYPGVAAVTRLIEVDVPAGSHTVVISGLPQSLDANSLRVEGVATGQLQIGSVEMRTQPLVSPAPVTNEVTLRLNTLRDDRLKKASEISALTSKQAMINAIGQQAPTILGGKDKPADPADWAKAWDAVGQGLAKVAEELREANAALKIIDDEINAIGRQGGGARPGLTRAANVSVESLGGAKATFKLTYQIGGVTWRPTYDAVLATGSAHVKPKLTLVRRANITQRTGEDWSDVTLAVSTAQPQGGTQAPDLPPLRAGFNEPSVVMQSAAPSRSRAAVAADGPAADIAKREAAPAPAPTPYAMLVTLQEGQIQVSGFSAQFAVPGRVSITADGSPRSFRLGSRDMEPTLGIKTVPALDPKAYLELKFTNEEEAPLMAGAVTLTRDGVFVGQGAIKQVASGDNVEMGFGVDDKVKVSRVPVRRRETEASWTQGQRGELREFKTVIKNLHDRQMRITVLDQIPFSENNTITVEALPNMTPATEKTVQDKRGVMGWIYDYKPGEEKEIRNGFRIRFPNDRELVLEPQAAGR